MLLLRREFRYRGRIRRIGKHADRVKLKFRQAVVDGFEKQIILNQVLDDFLLKFGLIQIKHRYRLVGQGVEVGDDDGRLLLGLEQNRSPGNG